MVAAALAATWCGRRRLVAAAVAAAVLTAVPCLVLGGWRVNISGEMAVPAVLALVVLLPLTKRAERPPASLLWLACLPLAVNLVALLAAASGLDIHEALPIATPSTAVLLSPFDTYLSLVPVLVADPPLALAPLV